MSVEPSASVQRRMFLQRICTWRFLHERFDIIVTRLSESSIRAAHPLSARRVAKQYVYTRHANVHVIWRHQNPQFSGLARTEGSWLAHIVSEVPNMGAYNNSVHRLCAPIADKHDHLEKLGPGFPSRCENVIDRGHVIKPSGD